MKKLYAAVGIFKTVINFILLIAGNYVTKKINGYNMFAYCNNNPVSYADTLGTAPWPTTYVSKDAYPRSSNLYKSMNNAAVAFARENYGRTRKEGIEYGSIIYSKTVAGSTYYTYGWRIKGTEEDISGKYKSK